MPQTEAGEQCATKFVRGGVRAHPKNGNAHQLPRDASCLPRSEVFCQRQDESTHSTKDGQHFSAVLHKQERGNDLPGTDLPSQTTMAVVHGEGHLPFCRSPTRDLECSSGRRVQNYEGPNGLEAKSPHVQQNQPNTRPLRDRFVCYQTDTPTAAVCQLETRSSGNDDRRLCNGLVQEKSLCQPTMELDRKGPSPMSEATSRACTDCPNLEGPTLVPHTPRNGDEDTTSDSTSRGLDPTNRSNQLLRCHTTTSRVEHLRQRYRSCQLSHKATEIIMASWRPKSSKSYDSLYGKWVRWCDQRNTNPVSGPIGDVVNFLANLFSEGYQYRSLNAYRSAISSVHEKVDGYEVGQHPLVSRLLKGAFHQRPPRPRYSTTWDVAIVTNYLDSLGENQSLSLADLTMKTAMLLALTRPSRASDLANLDIRSLKHCPEGVTLQTMSLPK